MRDLIFIHSILVYIFQTYTQNINTKKFTAMLDLREYDVWDDGVDALQMRHIPILACSHSPIIQMAKIMLISCWFHSNRTENL